MGASILMRTRLRTGTGPDRSVSDYCSSTDTFIGLDVVIGVLVCSLHWGGTEHVACFRTRLQSR